MPLPAVLAAKLAKRGLIVPRHKVSSKQKKNFKGSSGCPNKSNIYHTCTYWCDTQWKGVLSPDPKYIKRMQKMLMKYPLPHNWMEVFDKGIGRYYYWDMETDMVSWLPPKHPKAVKSESAAKLREQLQQGINNEESSRTDDDREERRKHKHSDRKDKDKDRDDRRHRHDDKDRRKKSRKSENNLDPMDPAAYSDIPQGTWSDGLENNKTRADSTASGVLFQQRPYPAPGEVLASNKSKSKKSVNFGNVSYSS